MRTLIIAPKNRDYSMALDDWIRRYEELRGEKVERFDPETPEGAQMVEVYDLPEWPAILKITSDGTEMYRHSGTSLPNPLNI